MKGLNVPAPLAYPVANFTAMRFSRNLSVARGVTVTVLSWHHKTKRAARATANRAHVRNKTTQGVAATGLPPAEYIRVVSNKTDLQCQQIANSLLADISQHEMNFEAELPGDLALTAQSSIQLVGTGMAFDQAYWPASIQSRYSLDEGCRMTVRARNVSPDMGLV